MMTSWKSATESFDFGPGLDFDFQEGNSKEEKKVLNLPSNIIVAKKSVTQNANVELHVDNLKRDNSGEDQKELLVNLSKDIEEMDAIIKTEKVQSNEDKEGINIFLPKIRSTEKKRIGKYKVKGEKEGLACDQCSFAAKKKQNLLQHISQHHDKIKHCCDQCNYKTFYTHILRRHVRIVHEGIPLSCNLCKYTVNNASALSYHKQSVHHGKYYPCDRCDFRTIFPSSLRTHQRVVHDQVKVSCDLCDYKGGSKYAVRDHKKAEHEQIKFQCDSCDFISKFKQNLIVHTKNVHSDSPTQFLCDQCDYTSKHLKALETHQKVKHEDRLLICSDCPFTNPYPSCLKVHINADIQSMLMKEEHLIVTNVITGQQEKSI